MGQNADYKSFAKKLMDDKLKEKKELVKVAIKIQNLPQEQHFIALAYAYLAVNTISPYKIKPEPLELDILSQFTQENVITAAIHLQSIEGKWVVILPAWQSVEKMKEFVHSSYMSWLFFSRRPQYWQILRKDLILSSLMLGEEQLVDFYSKPFKEINGYHLRDYEPSNVALFLKKIYDEYPNFYDWNKLLKPRTKEIQLMDNLL
jgi:hypothetical protein